MVIKKLLSKQRNTWMTPKVVTLIASVVVLVVLGVILAASRAATSVPNLEAESGVPAGSASIVSDPSASGGGAIAFGGFKHPGVLFNKAHLDLIKTKVNASAEPWLNSYNQALANWRGSDSFPDDQGVVATVDCGPSNVPDNGCSDLTNAAGAAYTQTLLWYITGQSKYAVKAKAILDNWSAVLQNFTNSNANFQAAWTAELMVPAAEILRYTPGSGWTQADSDQFAAMLTRAFVPQVDTIWSGGGANRLMSMIDATMDIAVFTNDRDMFNRAVSRWREQVPSIIYLSTDTNDDYPNLKDKGYPIPPPEVQWTKPSMTTDTMDSYWYFPSNYLTGLEGETCRDMDHTTMGLEAMMHGAETAYLQGVNLYGEEQNRIVTGLEFNTRYMAQQLSTGSVPSNVCGGTLKNQSYPVYMAGWELAYAHYHDVVGLSLPYTKAFIDTYVRPYNGTHIYTQFSGLAPLSFALSN